MVLLTEDLSLYIYQEVCSIVLDVQIFSYKTLYGCISSREQ